MNLDVNYTRKLLNKLLKSTKSGIKSTTVGKEKFYYITQQGINDFKSKWVEF
jgi:predicted transcriptional regulator